MTNLPPAKLAEALTKAQGTMSGAKKDKKKPHACGFVNMIDEMLFIIAKVEAYQNKQDQK